MQNDWNDDRQSARDVVRVVPTPSHSAGMPAPGLHTNLLVMLTLLRIAREVYGWLVRSFIAGFAFCLVIIAIFRMMTLH